MENNGEDLNGLKTNQKTILFRASRYLNCVQRFLFTLTGLMYATLPKCWCGRRIQFLTVANFLKILSFCVQGLDLRIEHFHCFSDHGEGGHYHYDVTPDDVQYTGFFNVAEKIYRIDRPLTTHNVGRD